MALNDALFGALLRKLAARDYRFVTITPASHARVLARPSKSTARTVVDVLGWSLPFARGVLVDELFHDLSAAGVIEERGQLLRCTIRVSCIGSVLYIHSAFPTTAPDAVFLGPDSYRFAVAITAELDAERVPAGARILDIGTGAGVGAITAALLCPDARVVATDINPLALRFAAINAAVVGVAIEPMLADSVAAVPGEFDLILINPPYIIDSARRAYRDGGDMHGAALPLRMTREAMAKLAEGGRLLLYTGSAIVDGEDRLRAALADAVAEAGFTLRYREIDPDVFGEELGSEAYAEVDRIALVCALIRRPRRS
ncbi:MAG: class I SAM-dependent methyltransferase [Novosphingobium sp.]